MSDAEPWTREKRNKIHAAMDSEADRAAASLGATHVVLLAFFADGEHVHMLDAGKAPMPLEELYLHLATVIATMKESGGDDIKIQ